MAKLEVESVLKDIQNATAELEDIKSLVNKALDLNVSPTDIVESVRKGLKEVGDRYERKEYFLMELVLAGSMASEVMDMLKPHFASASATSIGKVVIGTVAGDLHNIGKNIVIAMLTSVGFTVTDLGVDVSVERFLEAVEKEKPDILALSGLLTIVMDEMKRVIEKLKEAGLRDRVKVIVGGRPITKEFAKEIGADAYGRDAAEAVDISVRLLGRQS